MSILNNNGPTRDFEGAARQREIAQSRLEQKIANNQAIANAHRLPSGPGVVGGAEAQPPLVRPVVDVHTG